MHKWVYALGTTDIAEPRVLAKFDSDRDLVLVYNLKDKKQYGIAIKDISLEFDLIWYMNEWRYIMKRFLRRKSERI